MTPDCPSISCTEELESAGESPPTETEDLFVDSKEDANPQEDISPEKTDILSAAKINDAIEAALKDMDIIEGKVGYDSNF